MLVEIIEQLYTLENKDFVRFPYSFIHMNMINSKSSCKIISTLMNLLILDPSRKDEIANKIKNKEEIVPKISTRLYNYELLTDY